MLLIHFICIFYLMVLVRCDTIYKSETNTESYDGVTYPFNVLFSRQDVSDLDFGTPQRSHQINQRRSWLTTVPSSDYSTAALEEVLRKLKNRNLEQIATSPFGANGMVFATEFGYGTVEQNSGFSNTAVPKNVNRKAENKYTNQNTLDATTEFDETDYVDNLRILEARNKPRTVKEAKKEEEKKKEKCKFKFKDLFKFLHPKKKKCDPKPEDTKMKLIDQVPALPKNELKGEKKSTEITSTTTTVTSNVTDNHGSKKVNAAQKKKRHRRTVDQKPDVTSTQKYYNQKWLPNFKKREPTQADSRTYEVLSNKLSYKDFVDGFKYYLKFERDMARSNFSDIVRYEAHKHHNVDDIGKFILEKIPQVPVTESYNKPYDSIDRSPEFEKTTNTVRNGKFIETEQLDVSTEADTDVRLEKYDSTQTTIPTNLRRFDSLKKRLIDVQKPSWLRKKSISSYFDSKTSGPRIRRGLKPRTQNTIHFDTTEFPHSLKSDTAQLKDSTKNVAFAKVNLVETSKTKKPFRGFFGKFKKHKAKRDASGILKKLRQIFSNGQTTPDKAKGLTSRYGYPSDLYESMNIKYPMYKAPDMTDDLDVIMDKFNKPASQTSTTLLSYMEYYDTEPKMFSNDFQPDPDVPFELTTPQIKDKMLQKKLQTLQKEYDSVAARAFGSEYDTNIRINPPRTSPELFYKLTAFKEPATIVAHKAGRRTKTVTAPSKYPASTINDFQYDGFRDLLGLSKKQAQRLTNGYNEPATLNSKSPTHRYTITWHINDSDLGIKKQDHDREDKSGLTSASEIPAGVKVEDNPANHYSIKPSMLNNLDATESIKIKPRIDNTNRYKEKTTRQVKMTTMKFYDKNWSKTLVNNQVRSNKLPVTMNNKEIYKQLKPSRDMGFNVKGLSGEDNNDVVMVQTSTMLIATNKEKNEAHGSDNNYKYDIKIDKDRVSTSDRFRDFGKGIDTEEVENERVTSKTNGVKDTQSVFEEKPLPIHNKFMYDTVTGRKHVASVKNPANISPDKQQPQVLLKYPASKLDTNMHQKNYKTKAKTKSPPLLPTPWNLNGLETQSKYEDDDKTPYPSKVSDKRTKETTLKFDLSNMVDRFDHDFPGFEKKEKSTTAMRNMLDWFEKHYSDSINIGKQTTSKENVKFETSTVGRLIKDSWEKQDIDYDKTTKKLLNKENKPKSDIKKKPAIEGKAAKDSKKQSKEKEPKDHINGKPVKTITPAVKTTKKDGPIVADLGKEETIAADVLGKEEANVGRTVKDWLKTPMKIVKSKTKSGKNRKTARDMAIYLSDDLNNDVTETSTASADKYKKMKTSSTDNDFATRLPELHTPYYNTKKILSTENFLFEKLPNSKEKNHGNGRLTHNPNFSKTSFPASKLNNINKQTHVSELSKYDKEIWKEINENLALKHKVPEHKGRPEQVEIVQTYDIIYTSHGNMPFTNRSLSHVHSILKEMTNLKKRNLLKSSRALNHKTFNANKSRRRKRFTGVSERSKTQAINKVCFNVTPDGPDPEVAEKRAHNKKRETNEKQKVKNVAALEVVMDMMKNNDEVQQILEKPQPKNHEPANIIQVHIALPKDENMKRSLKRVRNIFTAKLSSPVDLEYQINSYYDNLETTMPPALSSGVYLLHGKDNLTIGDKFILEPIPNNLSLSLLLQRRLKSAINSELYNKVEETTRSDRFTKVTLSKEFVSAVNEHLLQLYETFAKNETKIYETTPSTQLNKVTLNSCLMTENIPAGLLLKDIQPKLKKRETNTKSKKSMLKWKTLKNLSEDTDRLSKRVCKPIPVDSEVMMELVLEINNLVEYMHEHCTEIQTYFWNNPSGGRKLRDTVRKVNKLLDKYSKKFSTCNFCHNNLFKTVSKRDIAEIVDVPKKYELNNLIDDIENLASDIINATRSRVCVTETMQDRCNNLFNVVDKCVSNVGKRNKISKLINDRDVYLLDKVKVNIICNTERPNKQSILLLDKPIQEPLKRKWSLKDFLRRNYIKKESKKLMTGLHKREVGSLGSPLNADTGGSFWSNYIHKFNNLSKFEDTFNKNNVVINDVKGLSNFNVTKQEYLTAKITTYNVNTINKRSEEEIKVTTSMDQVKKDTFNSSNGEHYFTTDVLNTVAVTPAERSISVEATTLKLNDLYIHEKELRNIKSKHKEKHMKSKISNTSTPMTSKSKIGEVFDNAVITYDNNNNNRAHLKTQKKTWLQTQGTTNVKSTPSQSTPGNPDKETYKNSAVTSEPVMSTVDTNVPTTPINKINIIRHIMVQINKIGDKYVKDRSSSSTGKCSYEGDNNSSEPNTPSQSEVTETSKQLTLSKPNLIKIDDGSYKLLLLSILKYETKRISKDTNLIKTNSFNEEQAYEEDDSNEYVRFNANTDEDGEIRAQKRQRKIRQTLEDLKYLALKDDPIMVLCEPVPKAKPRGMYILLVNCSATFPRGNYLLKPLGEGAFRNAKIVRPTRRTNRDIASVSSDELDMLKESDERKDEKTRNRRRRTGHWKMIKKWFHGARTCSCKCKPHKTMCPACAASDAVMTDVIFRLGNIISYVNEHSPEIEEYFKVNPSGAAEFRNALKETDKCLKNYSKRAKGQCLGKPCEAFKFVRDKDDDYKDVT